MKLEWATVKDDKLVLGSFGKEYTAPGQSSIHPPTHPPTHV